MRYPIDKVELLKEFKKSKRRNFKWTERFGELLLQLHKLILQKPNFHNYSSDFKQDMVQYSCLRLFKGLKNFDESRAIFPYLYRAIHVNFWQYCKQFYKRRTKYNQYVYDQLLVMQTNSQLDDEQKKILLGLSQDQWIKK